MKLLADEAKRAQLDADSLTIDSDWRKAFDTLRQAATTNGLVVEGLSSTPTSTLDATTVVFVKSNGRTQTSVVEHVGQLRAEYAELKANLFAEQAYAARKAYEASRSDFHKWIETQRNRDDAVGDLASDVMRDSTFPVGVETKREVLHHLRRQSIWVIEAVHAAWKAFEDQRRPPQPMVR